MNHVGLRLKDVRSKVESLKQQGVAVITREELADAKEDVYFNEPQKTYIAFLLSPDGTKVELFEDKTSPDPAANHHIHFYAPDVAAMKAWYVDNFGAAAGQRGGMEAAQLPGVNLTFSPASGRGLRHQGALRRPHRIRGPGARRPVQEARGKGNRVRQALCRAAGAESRARFSLRSLGDVHRAHRGAFRALKGASE